MQKEFENAVYNDYNEAGTDRSRLIMIIYVLAERLQYIKRSDPYDGAAMKKETIDRIRKFTEDRDWEQFHSPANLAKSISIEANELLECFQWSDTDYDIEHVREELADVIVYCQNMLDKLELDADEIVNAKMRKNELKYPVEKAKGSAAKYTEL